MNLIMGWLIGFAILFGVIAITIWKRIKSIGATWPAESKLAVKDKVLICAHCGCDSFYKREGLVNTSLFVLFHLGCWNKSAACYTCSNCGFVHWFIAPEEKIYKELDKRGEYL